MQTNVEIPNRLIASDRVEGTSVYGADGEKLGSVERFMVDKMTGQAEYAVLAFGGIFGLGHDHHPVPWKALDYDPDKGGYVIGLTRDKLQNGPRYNSEGEEPSYDRAYGQYVHSYYGYPYL